jgi:hypothetical protein
MTIKVEATLQIDMNAWSLTAVSARTTSMVSRGPPVQVDLEKAKYETTFLISTTKILNAAGGMCLVALSTS